MINLQLFATQTTATDSLAYEMKQYYDKRLIDLAGPKLVHDQFGQKRNIPSGNGKTVEFRKFSPLAKAMTPITEGVTPDGNALTVTHVTATIAQYGDFIKQSDVLELTAIDPIIVEATKLLGNQAGLTLDTVVRNVLMTGSNVTYAEKVVNNVLTAVEARNDLDTTAVLTVDTIMQVVAKLEAQNAPKIDGAYVGIIHPYCAYQLMRDPEWVDAHKYTDSKSLFEGEIGMIAGVRFVKTTEAKIYKNSGNHSVYCTLILGADAYGVTEIEGGGLEMIIKQKGSAGTADPLDQVSSEGWKALKTAEILVDNYMVRVESCVPKFDSIAAN